MRDAFGGAFMIKVFLVFIAVYIGFTAIALNYAKAFKVKNKVIEYLESSEIIDLNLTAAQRSDLEEFIEIELLGNMNYNVSEFNICDRITTTDDTGKTIAYCHNAGIVIKEEPTYEIKVTAPNEGIVIDDPTKLNNTEGVYYKVETYLGWSMPFFKGFASIGGKKATDTPMGVWQISGETRVIVNQ